MTNPVWYGCYDGSWKGLETPDSLAHPAKMAQLLTVRIFQYLEERGYLRQGQTVVDPFFGVGSTAVIGATRGYFVCGVELEPRFMDFWTGWRCPGNRWPVGMGHVCAACARDRKSGVCTETHYSRGNYDLHLDSWKQFQDPLPMAVRGDSRRLCELLRQVLQSRASAVVGSPPFGRQISGAGGLAVSGVPARPGAGGASGNTGYQCQGETSGQLADMPEGNVSAVVGSPPFIQTQGGAKGVNPQRERGEGARAGRSAGAYQFGGDSEVGQLADMPEGDVLAIVSSPPYEGCDIGAFDCRDGSKRVAQLQRAKDQGKPLGRESLRILERGVNPNANLNVNPYGYGEESGQLGKFRGDTFWEAAKDIVLQCLQILRPGAVAVWVTKDFVRDKKRVRFSQDWVTLCQACGFELVEWIHASQVTEQRHPGLFGEDVVTRKEKKGFFRRMHESRMAPDDERRIDHEDVLVFRKPEILV